MKEVKFDDIFDCSIDTYWDKIFFDDAFNHRLFRDTLQFSEWTATVTEDNDAVLKRTVVVQPPVGEVPAAVKKVLGDNFGYKEHGTFDRKTKRYHVDIETNMAKEKTRVHGDIWLEPAGEGKCRRLGKFQVEVKIMMVGGIIEDRIINDMKRDFGRGADFTNQWIRERGL